MTLRRRLLVFVLGFGGGRGCGGRGCRRGLFGLGGGRIGGQSLHVALDHAALGTGGGSGGDVKSEIGSELLRSGRSQHFVAVDGGSGRRSSGRRGGGRSGRRSGRRFRRAERGRRSGRGGAAGGQIEFLSGLADDGHGNADGDFLAGRDQNFEHGAVELREFLEAGFTGFQREERVAVLHCVSLFDDPVGEQRALLGDTHLRHENEISHFCSFLSLFVEEVSG